MKKRDFAKRVIALIVICGCWSQVALAQLPQLPQHSFWLGHPAPPAPTDQGAFHGSAVAVGDFNCDGLGDLATSAPWRDVRLFLPPIDVTYEKAGWVSVGYGTPSGLASGSQVLSTLNFGTFMTIEEFDFFGDVLAVGDFNGDGCDDLAIGVPRKDVNGVVDVGAVAIALGTFTGLQPSTVIFQGDNGIASLREVEDEFGHALAAGDVDGDGFDDLVVGVPKEDLFDVSDDEDSGAIHIILGADNSTGIALSGHLFYSRLSVDIPGPTQSEGFFGWAVAVSKGLDFQIGGSMDVYVSEIGRDIGAASSAGAVLHLFLAHNPGSVLVVEIDQDSAGTPGVAEPFDFFGSSLAVGDFDGDGIEDVAIGVSGEDVTVDGVTVSGAGAVNIRYEALFGGPTDQFWTQANFESVAPGIGDSLGEVLTVGDFDGDGTDDLAIAVTGEDFAGEDDVGLVHILYGLETFGFVGLDLRQTLLLFFPASQDGFGEGLAAGPLGPGNSDDLVVGVPGRNVSSVIDAGLVVAYESSALFSDGFESGDLSEWSSLP